MGSEPKLVELLHFADCPNMERTRALVEKVAEETKIPVTIRLCKVGGEEVERVRFLGSPSVRVDGHDVEPGADERETFVYACRVYRTERGLSGQPTRAWLEAALLSS